jgi:hypothetical protein
MEKDGELWRRSRLRQVKYLNNILEQDHRNVKRLTDPGLGFGGFWTARRTLAGYEAMAMMRKRQVRNIDGGNIRAQAEFIAGRFHAAAWVAISSSRRRLAASTESLQRNLKMRAFVMFDRKTSNIVHKHHATFLEDIPDKTDHHADALRHAQHSVSHSSSDPPDLAVMEVDPTEVNHSGPIKIEGGRIVRDYEESRQAWLGTEGDI